MFKINQVDKISKNSTKLFDKKTHEFIGLCYQGEIKNQSILKAIFSNIIKYNQFNCMKTPKKILRNPNLSTKIWIKTSPIVDSSPFFDQNS